MPITNEYKYKDRGMIKWAPFDSLFDTFEETSNLSFDLTKKSKIVISEEKSLEIDQLIQEYFNNKVKVIITYYFEGHYLKRSGLIRKLDLIKKAIILDEYLINYQDIYNVTNNI
jgi:hypothetical protein